MYLRSQTDVVNKINDGSAFIFGVPYSSRSKPHNRERMWTTVKANEI